MKVTFNEEYLEELYTEGKSRNKKYRFQPQIVRGYQKAVKYLIQAHQYRVEFSIEESEEEPIVTICTILELSNHYK